MANMKSCGPCSLKTGCYLVALYTFILGILLVGFNSYDVYYSYGVHVNHHQWSSITSLVFAVCLFFAAVCLFLGLRNNSNALIGAWTVIFLIYLVVQISFIIYSIYDYIAFPEGRRPSYLGEIIVFALLIAVNITSFIAVRSYRGGSVLSINI
jgi:hypothetical protein